MRWQLRARAVERGIPTAAGMRRRLAAAGLVVSAGKMSALWSGQPVSVRLDDLETICLVLACEPSDLLMRQHTWPVPAQSALCPPTGNVPAGNGPPVPATRLATAPGPEQAAAAPAAAPQPPKRPTCRPLPPL